jgi:hypothetical protein
MPPRHQQETHVTLAGGKHSRNDALTPGFVLLTVAGQRFQLSSSTALQKKQGLRRSPSCSFSLLSAHSCLIAETSSHQSFCICERCRSFKATYSLLHLLRPFVPCQVTAYVLPTRRDLPPLRQLRSLHHRLDQPPQEKKIKSAQALPPEPPATAQSLLPSQKHHNALLHVRRSGAAAACGGRVAARPVQGTVPELPEFLRRRRPLGEQARRRERVTPCRPQEAGDPDPR